MRSEFLWVGIVLFLSAGCAARPYKTDSKRQNEILFAAPQTPEQRRSSEASGPSYAISTQGRHSSEAAERILRGGGNIIDAAIAASFAISVERPQSTGIGGGGFLLYHEARTGRTYAVDFRERAPLRAQKTMFLDKKGEVIPDLSTDGIRAVAVPGLVAGLVEIHGRLGKLPWKDVVQPAVDLAEDGFEVYPYLERALAKRRPVLAQYPASASVFLHKDGSPLRLGERLVQKDLARTLRAIANNGKAGFYEGFVADSILSESRRLGGILQKKDFDSYRVFWREPVEGSFHGYRIVSMPPPSSGGASVVQILQTLEEVPLRKMGFQTPESIHWTASSMQLVFADRARYMGDPDFVRVPLAGLISKDYAQTQRARIHPDKATPSERISHGTPPGAESPDTTHFSIMDREGNIVASTQTINGWMGSGIVAPGTGVLLNNEMDDFSAKPGASNLFGAIGGEANSVQPGKTPLSSMSPTLVFKGQKPVMSLGAPGGTRIITCVAQTLLNYLVYGLSLYESVAAIRFHHQWRPDQIEFDSPGPSEDVTRRLREMGHTVLISPDAVYCRVMAVAREGGALHAVSDPRDIGRSLAR